MGKLKSEKPPVELQTKIKDLEKKLKILYQVVEAVSSLNIREVLAKIVKIAIEITKADSCFIYLLDPKNQELSLYASKNPHPKLLKKIKMKMGEGITGWVAREKKAVNIFKDAAKDPRFKRFKNLPEDRYQAFLSVPILKKKKTIGVINIQHKDKHLYSICEKNLLSAIGKLTGGAVENARLIEESIELKNALETRKAIEKAKGILMEELGISEEEAYEKIQKQSMDTRKGLGEISQAIILTQSLKK